MNDNAAAHAVVAHAGIFITSLIGSITLAILLCGQPKTETAINKTDANIESLRNEVADLTRNINALHKDVQNMTNARGSVALIPVSAMSKALEPSVDSVKLEPFTPSVIATPVRHIALETTHVETKATETACVETSPAQLLPVSVAESCETTVVADNGEIWQPTKETIAPADDDTTPVEKQKKATKRSHRRRRR